MNGKLAAALLLSASLPAVQAQYGGGYGGYPGSGSGSGSGSSSNGFGFGGGVGFDIDKAERIRAIHGILGALAFVVLFPVGSILMRIFPGRLALWTHAIFQIMAYCVYIAAAGLGFYLVQEVQIPFGGGSLLTNSSVNYHPIIGIVVLVALFFQPILGIIHHKQFKKLHRRQIWSHLHLFNGRIMIILGIINGGLGLYIAGASRSQKVAYGVVAAVLGSGWLMAALVGEVRRCRVNRKIARHPGLDQSGKMSDGSLRA